MRLRKARTQLRRTIGGTTNVTARMANGAIIGGTSTRRISSCKLFTPFSTNKKKGGARRLPLFLVAASTRKRAACAGFASDSHRESGVLSFRSALSPVESLSPPELYELTARLYASVSLVARGELEKFTGAEIGGPAQTPMRKRVHCSGKIRKTIYLMNSVSRS
jgi:hypothetical protein